MSTQSELVTLHQAVAELTKLVTELRAMGEEQRGRADFLERRVQQLEAQRNHTAALDPAGPMARGFRSTAGWAW